MPPLIALDTWNERTPRPERSPKAICFIIAEGANSELWYFTELALHLAKQNIPELIELKPIERTDDDQNKSHPHALLEQAESIREGKFGFNKDTDRIVAVFDVDIYKGNNDQYQKDLQSFSGMAEVAVTNPSFELYLLLHKEDAYKTYIEPYREKILKNAYVEGTHRRFISRHANDVLGINVKSNKRVAGFAHRFGCAIKEERHLNQDPATAMGRLTSNIGKVIKEVIEMGRIQR